MFPRIGVGVKPTVGSAIFWYNLHDTGEPDRMTLHGACPVLYGTKWGKNIINLYLKYVKSTFIAVYISYLEYYHNLYFSVANKWIREGAQTFIRRCPLSRNNLHK